MMKRMQWVGLRLAEKLGAIGLMVIATALICIVFVFFAWLPARESFNALKVVKNHTSEHVAPMVLTPAERLQKFAGLFPKRMERAAQIQSIMSKAKALDLIVDNVSYKTDQQANALLSNTHVDFTINSTYPEMRTFLNSVLTDMPFVSLDQLTISREDIASDVIEVRMRLTLHLVA